MGTSVSPWVQAERVPSSEPRLEQLTKFLTIALSARKLLRDRAATLPEPGWEIMAQFFPLLGEMMLESMLRDSDDEMEEEEEGEGEEGEVEEEMVQVIGEDGEVTEVARTVPKGGPAAQIIQALTRLMASSEVIRKVALTYALRQGSTERFAAEYHPPHLKPPRTVLSSMTSYDELSMEHGTLQ